MFMPVSPEQILYSGTLNAADPPRRATIVFLSTFPVADIYFRSAVHIRLFKVRAMKKWNTASTLVVVVIGIVLMSGCTNMSSTGTVPETAAPTPALPVPVTVITTEKTIDTVPVTLPPAITPEKTREPISDSALRAKIQEAKNRMSMYKDSDKADTILARGSYCEVKQSKELGCVIDVNYGDMNYVKGDYGSIDGDLFRQNMSQGHTYIILHSHSKNWIICEGEETINFDTFSLNDLAMGYNLGKQGYHIQNLIVVSDKDYEVHPVTRDDWKTKEEVYMSVERIEQRREMTFHTEYNGVKYYDVDNLMPFLTRELGYVYTINNAVVPH
jgi:hypothetical protein